ncbi:MAG: carbamoyltransferase HypF [Akkermansia sp.]|nr:carbamoyltransferase HypF [Akkermansia sp.]
MKHIITTIDAPEQALKVNIDGAVQGVGFRPFVYRLATKYTLRGYVCNTTGGVELWLEGEGKKAMVDELISHLPEHSRIDKVDIKGVTAEGYKEFRILTSSNLESGVPIMLPDLAPCSECLKEMTEPNNRRYLYPFINCTHCGPRYSIIENMPYDRPYTAMKGFEMCEECRREYEDEKDRRFHAQPIACPKCGPQLQLRDKDGQEITPPHLWEEVTARLKAGQIIGMLGVGGFQLLVDATQEEAVKRLRQRKGRDARPFAVMVPNISYGEKLGKLNKQERKLLLSYAAPIVLAERHPQTELAPAVCQFSRFVGLMLPSSPLHALLMKAWGKSLVVTSGNISGEPLCVSFEEAKKKLRGIADVFLTHNRPVLRPVDDSVVRVCAGKEMVLRRARGYAPLPVWHTGENTADILAYGAELKNTLCLSKNGVVIMSQHLGDMISSETVKHAQKTCQLLEETLNFSPELQVYDIHPDQTLKNIKHQTNPQVPSLYVQHHEAHVWACVAEHQVALPALGVAWDGVGYGDDGSIWGGEFFYLPENGKAKRIARIKPFRLIGGDRAAKHPARCALSLVLQCQKDCPEIEARLNNELGAERKAIEIMAKNGINSPWCSSMGRLFDAVAFLCGFRGEQGCEGHAAMYLEGLVQAKNDEREEAYKWHLTEGEIIEADWSEVLMGIERDVQNKVPVSHIARKFHESLVDLVRMLIQKAGLTRVALGGGCFQNAFLLEGLEQMTQHIGCELHVPEQIPCNDGGISFGQVVAANRYWQK